MLSDLSQSGRNHKELVSTLLREMAKIPHVVWVNRKLLGWQKVYLQTSRSDPYNEIFKVVITPLPIPKNKAAKFIIKALQ